MVRIPIKLLYPDAQIPRYAHGSAEDAGLDLVAVERVVLWPHAPTLVKTGLAIALPPGFEAQIRSRSGLALKYGVQVYNAPGTVDPSYRGEIGVILAWNGYRGNWRDCRGVEIQTGPDARFVVEPGDRIAQLVVTRYAPAEMVVLAAGEELPDSVRGEGGFGSTGQAAFVQAADADDFVEWPLL